MFKTKLKIEGMMCNMCEAHVNDALRKAFKVEKVSSSHKKGETIIMSDEKLDETSLKKIIDGTGYGLVSYEEVPYYEKPKFHLFGRKD